MKKIIAFLMAFTMCVGFTSCGESSADSSYNESSINKKEVTEEKTQSDVLITENEAANIAQEHIENKLARGDVQIKMGSNHTATSFDTVSYGDASIEYNSNSNTYNIKCKATCWGYDSYGSVVDKYKFDANVTVNAKSGYASSSLLILSKS